MVDVRVHANRPPASATESPVLAVRDLRTEFDTPRGVLHAVNGVSFTINEGELVGLVGESGCGKSVTARSIMNLVQPPGRIVGGEIEFGGRDLRSLSKKAYRKVRGTEISFIPQNPFGALNPVMKIGTQMENVIRAHRRVSAAEAFEISREILKGVGIAGPERVLRGYVHELSGGMAQRVVIATSLLLNPRLVIADEPTTGLDVTLQRQLLDLIMAQLQADRSRSMIFVTHDLGIVAQYCKRVIVMYAGKVVETGDVASVFRRPAHPYTEALLGAIPRPGHELVSLRGTVPNLIDYPTGCPFANRCGYSHLIDSSVAPSLRLLTDGHYVSCHLPEGVSNVDRAR